MSALRLTLTAGLCALITACTTPPPASPPIAGGWSRSAVDDQTRAVAAFAIGRMTPPGLSVVKIEAAETQVAAGLNYRLTLKLSDGSHHRVVVWRRLDGSLELSSDINLP